MIIMEQLSSSFQRNEAISYTDSSNQLSEWPSITAIRKDKSFNAVRNLQTQQTKAIIRKGAVRRNTRDNSNLASNNLHEYNIKSYSDLGNMKNRLQYLKSKVAESTSALKEVVPDEHNVASEKLSTKIEIEPPVMSQRNAGVDMHTLLLRKAEAMLSEVTMAISAPNNSPLEDLFLQREGVEPEGAAPSSYSEPEIEFLLDGLPDAYEGDYSRYYSDFAVSAALEEGGRRPPSQLLLPSFYANNQQIMEKLLSVTSLTVSLEQLDIFSGRYGLRRKGSYFLLRLPVAIGGNGGETVAMISLSELEVSRPTLTQQSRNSWTSNMSDFFVGSQTLQQRVSFPLKLSDEILSQWLSGDGKFSNLQMELFGFLQPTGVTGPKATSGTSALASVPTPVRFGSLSISLKGLLSSTSLSMSTVVDIEADDQTLTTVCERMKAIHRSTPISSTPSLPPLKSKMGQLRVSLSLNTDERSQPETNLNAFSTSITTAGSSTITKKNRDHLHSALDFVPREFIAVQNKNRKQQPEEQNLTSFCGLSVFQIFDLRLPKIWRNRVDEFNAKFFCIVISYKCLPIPYLDNEIRDGERQQEKRKEKNKEVIRINVASSDVQSGNLLPTLSVDHHRIEEVDVHSWKPPIFEVWLEVTSSRWLLGLVRFADTQSFGEVLDLSICNAASGRKTGSIAVAVHMHSQRSALVEDMHRCWGKSRVLGSRDVSTRESEFHLKNFRQDSKTLQQNEKATVDYSSKEFIEINSLKNIIKDQNWEDFPLQEEQDEDAVSVDSLNRVSYVLDAAVSVLQSDSDDEQEKARVPLNVLPANNNFEGSLDGFIAAQVISESNEEEKVKDTEKALEVNIVDISVDCSCENIRDRNSNSSFMGFWITYCLPSALISSDRMIDHGKVKGQSLQKLWWDSDSAALNSINRHIFESPEGEAAHEVISSKKVEWIFSVHANSSDGDGDEDFGKPLAEGVITAEKWLELLTRGGSSAVINLPLKPLSSERSNGIYLPEILPLRICHRLEPIHLKKAEILNSVQNAPPEIISNNQTLSEKGPEEEEAASISDTGKVDVDARQGERDSAKLNVAVLELRCQPNSFFDGEKDLRLFFSSCVVSNCSSPHSSSDSIFFQRKQYLSAMRYVSRADQFTMSIPLTAPANLPCPINTVDLLTFSSSPSSEEIAPYCNDLRDSCVVVSLYFRRPFFRRRDGQAQSFPFLLFPDKTSQAAEGEVEEDPKSIRLTDHYAGSAVVDLALLSLGQLPRIEGWYHIMDGLQNVVGQVKVAVTLSLPLPGIATDLKLEEMHGQEDIFSPKSEIFVAAGFTGDRRDELLLDLDEAEVSAVGFDELRKSMFELEAVRSRLLSFRSAFDTTADERCEIEFEIRIKEAPSAQDEKSVSTEEVSEEISSDLPDPLVEIKVPGTPSHYEKEGGPAWEDNAHRSQPFEDVSDDFLIHGRHEVESISNDLERNDQHDMDDFGQIFTEDEDAFMDEFENYDENVTEYDKIELMKNDDRTSTSTTKSEIHEPTLILEDERNFEMSNRNSEALREREGFDISDQSENSEVRDLSSEVPIPMSDAIGPSPVPSPLPPYLPADDDTRPALSLNDKEDSLEVIDVALKQDLTDFEANQDIEKVELTAVGDAAELDSRMKSVHNSFDKWKEKCPPLIDEIVVEDKLISDQQLLNLPAFAGARTADNNAEVTTMLEVCAANSNLENCPILSFAEVDHEGSILKHETSPNLPHTSPKSDQAISVQRFIDKELQRVLRSPNQGTSKVKDNIINLSSFLEFEKKKAVQSEFSPLLSSTKETYVDELLNIMTLVNPIQAQRHRGKQKLFVDTETERISNIMKGVFNKLPSAI